METTKVFRSGNGQAVQIPQHLQLPADTDYIQRIGSALVLLPTDDPWAPLFLAGALLTDDFPEQPEQQAWQERD